MDDLRADFLRYVAQTSPDPIGIEIERAEGAWLYARDGRLLSCRGMPAIDRANSGACSPAEFTNSRQRKAIGSAPPTSIATSRTSSVVMADRSGVELSIVSSG
jgi:hypothetical protein